MFRYGCSRKKAEATGARRPELEFLPADNSLPEKLVSSAQRAARLGAGLFAVPGTTKEQGKARAQDIVGTQVILVDLDDGDIHAKRDHLVRWIGPPSLEVASGGMTNAGRRKLHLYWRLKEAASDGDIARACAARHEFALKVGGDLHFKSAHQPIRVAGSIHAKHGQKRLVEILSCNDNEFELRDLENAGAIMPEIEGLARSAVTSAKPTVNELFKRKVCEGGVVSASRFEANSRVIGYWIRRYQDGVVSREQAWEEIVAYNEANVRPPWPIDRLKRETKALWKRDSENHAKKPNDVGRSRNRQSKSGADLSEDALALEFTERQSEDWRYVAAWGAWLVWDGVRWRRETTLRAVDLSRAICRECAQALNHPRLAARIASNATIAAVERLARADRRHAATTDEWDSDNWLLNTPGGVVDLRTGENRSHDRTDRITKTAGATPGDASPTWSRFLDTITASDKELQSYLQRVVGYCLTGVTSEHAIFFLHGTGANGKSVFLSTVAAIAGDYSTAAPMDMFMAATGERHPTDMAGLRGARLVTAVETEQGRRWAESKIKALTGGDKITARFMRQDFFEFVPQFKLVVAGNHKPEIRNVDQAMQRRLHLVPFTVTIPLDERDKTLSDKLLAERDGILAWAIEGCLLWQKHGLAPPRSVMAATEQYFEAEDAVGRWLSDTCELGRKFSEASSALFASWKRWAEDGGEFVGSQKAFSEKLASRGLEPYRDRDGRGFRSVRLRQGSESTDSMVFSR
jgi:putative DNA primase/helicase